MGRYHFQIDAKTLTYTAANEDCGGRVESSQSTVLSERSLTPDEIQRLNDLYANSKGPLNRSGKWITLGDLTGGTYIVTGWFDKDGNPVTGADGQPVTKDFFLADRRDGGTAFGQLRAYSPRSGRVVDWPMLYGGEASCETKCEMQVPAQDPAN
jgi:hypothetical protein